MFTKDEVIRTEEATAKYCQTCIHAAKPVIIQDNIINRASFIMCEKYSRKPNGILWNDSECEFYEEK